MATGFGNLYGSSIVPDFAQDLDGRLDGGLDFVERYIWLPCATLPARPALQRGRGSCFGRGQSLESHRFGVSTLPGVDSLPVGKQGAACEMAIIRDGDACVRSAGASVVH